MAQVVLLTGGQLGEDRPIPSVRCLVCVHAGDQGLRGFCDLWFRVKGLGACVYQGLGCKQGVSASMTGGLRSLCGLGSDA